MRTSRYLFSDAFSPWMRGVAELARIIEQRRKPLPSGDPFIVHERSASEQVFKAIEETRKQRDATEEQIFARLYGAAGPTSHRSEAAAARTETP
jgi:hypothetical protein